MQHRQGFILVTALGVSLLILILGLGIIYMAQSNLDVASNLRQNTEVRARAEAGLEHAIVTLRVSDNTNNWGISSISNTATGTIPPATAPAPLQLTGSGYSVTITPIGYAPFSGTLPVGQQPPIIPNQVRVRSTATGGRNAEYTAEAVVSRNSSINAGSNSSVPAFPFEGLRSNSAIGLQSCAVFNDSGMYARNGYQGNSIQNGCVSGTNSQGQGFTLPSGQPSTPPVGANQLMATGASPTECTPSWACDQSLRNPQTVPTQTYTFTLGREMQRAGFLNQTALDAARASNNATTWYYDQLRTYCAGRWRALPQANQPTQVVIGGPYNGLTLAQAWTQAMQPDANGAVCIQNPPNGIPSYVELGNRTIVLDGSIVVDSTQSFSGARFFATGGVTFNNVINGSNMSFVMEQMQLNGGASLSTAGFNTFAFRQSQALSGNFGNLTGCTNENTANYTEVITDGNLTMNNGANIRGVIYSSGQTMLNGNNVIIGGVSSSSSSGLGIQNNGTITLCGASPNTDPNGVFSSAPQPAHSPDSTAVVSRR